MFTPPPSPIPDSSRTQQEEQDDYFAINKQPETAPDSKAARGRRLRLIAILVPSLLILITISSRYAVRPAESSYSMHTLGRRQSSSNVTTPTQVGTPTIPTQSTVPTPFPQPFDEITANFSTNSCQDFFANMTSTTPFRSCRAFSLLLSSSDDFLRAQRDLSTLNNIVWGTCNPPLGVDVCASNTNWFASAMEGACSTELNNRHPLVESALNGLRSYKFMNTVGCLTNARSNTYCYLDAVSSTNPSDAYYFQLGIGSPLPPTTNSSCSTCVQSIMNIYAANAQATADDQQLGLSKVFPAAQHLTTQQCGSNFAQAASVNAALSRSQFLVDSGLLRLLNILCPIIASLL